LCLKKPARKLGDSFVGSPIKLGRLEDKKMNQSNWRLALTAALLTALLVTALAPAAFAAEQSAPASQKGCQKSPAPFRVDSSPSCGWGWKSSTQAILR
jgi:hypothetical protein